jgi:hypothetical protein
LIIGLFIALRTLAGTGVGPGKSKYCCSTVMDTLLKIINNLSPFQGREVPALPPLLASIN